MSQYYNVVPWYNSEEWHLVYEQICSPASNDNDKTQALYTLSVWKARCPSLPSGIESTLSLLEVYLKDVRYSNEGIDSDLMLRLAYSSAVMRFVNHMLDTETAKGISLYQAAKNMDLPDWLIDLRHDTAHSNKLPSLELLREAASIALDWLRIRYWDQHKEFIKDYIIDNNKITIYEGNKIESLLSLYISLGICTSLKVTIKNVADIPDNALKEAIVNDLDNLFGNEIKLTNLKTVTIVNILNMLNEKAKIFVNCKNIENQIRYTLLQNDSVILSLELVDMFSQNNFSEDNYLCKEFIQCFELLLTFLHTNDFIFQFILDLIEITQRDDALNETKKLAAFWIAEILQALKRSKMFLFKMKMSTATSTHKDKEELRSLFVHWFPNEKACPLLLDLQKDVPDELTNLTYIQPIISKYNPYLKYFINELLGLLRPQLPSDTSDKICKLAELIAPPEGLPLTVNKVYTVEDVRAALQDQNVSDSESDCIEVEMDSQDCSTLQLDNNLSNPWKLASNKWDWASCPIGQLPIPNKEMKAKEIV